MKHIDTEAAAVMLGVHPRTVRKMVAAGTLTNHGTTRRIRLDVDQVGKVAEGRYSVMSCRPCP